MGKKENQLSRNDEVCTPEDVYQPVLDALGWKRFDLDPCSHPKAIVPVKTRILLPKYRRRMRGESQGVVYGDGLYLPWTRKRVWLNPPYSQLQYIRRYPWLIKAQEEAARCVGFLPARTSSGWWHDWLRPYVNAVGLVRGRVQHVGEEFGSPFHQVLVFWGFTALELERIEAGFEANGWWLVRRDRGWGDRE